MYSIHCNASIFLYEYGIFIDLVHYDAEDFLKTSCTSLKRFIYSIHCDTIDCLNSLHECRTIDWFDSLWLKTSCPSLKRFIYSIHCDTGDCLNSLHECRTIHWFDLLWWRWICFTIPESFIDSIYCNSGDSLSEWRTNDSFHLLRSIASIHFSSTMSIVDSIRCHDLY